MSEMQYLEEVSSDATPVSRSLLEKMPSTIPFWKRPFRSPGAGAEEAAMSATSPTAAPRARIPGGRPFLQGPRRLSLYGNWSPAN